MWANIFECEQIFFQHPYLLELPLLLPPDDLLEVVPPELQQLVHVQAEVHATLARSGERHTDAENNGMQFSDNETMNSNTQYTSISIIYKECMIKLICLLFHDANINIGICSVSHFRNI